jgi:hypothetical protein
MSIINRLTSGLIYKDGESPGYRTGMWQKHGNYWIHTKIVHLPTYIKHGLEYLLAILGCRWARIAIGKALGYGGCYRCGMTWNYVKGKTIYYTEGSGMFPLCAECFDKLPPEEIDPYIEKLVMSWLDSEWHHKQNPQELIESAKAEVREMKLGRGRQRNGLNVSLSVKP